jgi:prepilin-type processing-associated H-X9-DG protein
LKQVCFAVQNYLDTHGTFPPGTLASPTLPPEKRLSWFVTILPYLEANDLWSRADKARAWDDERNQHLLKMHMVYISCPASRSDASSIQGLTSYIGMAGLGSDAATLSLDDKRAGIFGYDRLIRLSDIKDGASTTIMIMETAKEQGPWAAGGPATVRGLDPDQQPYLALDGQFGLKHRTTFYCTNPAGSNVAFVDGHVQWLLSSVSSKTLEAMATIAAGDDPGDY